MTEILVLDLLSVASALVYGAGTERGLARLSCLQGRARSWAARAAAALLSGLALVYWRQLEPGPAALLIVLVGLMALSTLWTLLAPLAPRLAWRTALGALLVLLPLLWLGGPP